jgi:hypothetical protein
MSHRARSRRPTLGRQPLLKEPEFEHPQRIEKRRRHRRIEHRPDVAQVSALADQRGDRSWPDYYLSKIILEGLLPPIAKPSQHSAGCTNHHPQPVVGGTCGDVESRGAAGHHLLVRR